MILVLDAAHDERRPSSRTRRLRVFSQKRDAVTHRSRAAAHMISSTINQPHHVSYPTYVRTSRSCARPRTYVRAGVVPCRAVPCRCTRGSRCRSSLPGRRQTIHQLRRHGWLAATCRGRGYQLLAVARWLAVCRSRCPPAAEQRACVLASLSHTHTTYESEEKGKGGQARVPFPCVALQLLMCAAPYVRLPFSL